MKTTLTVIGGKFDLLISEQEIDVKFLKQSTIIDKEKTQKQIDKAIRNVYLTGNNITEVYFELPSRMDGSKYLK